eukprot:TRINITY_DN21223_c0_g1_i1.p1 TRINITY_DN21223_c0_g1~~TRINITY_DN21223_c0_g1_i1.p1  ORF type:complete len:323 (-),score=73.22 TRINITY_DN21223_c0_g1_i1:56-1024(-)
MYALMRCFIICCGTLLFLQADSARVKATVTASDASLGAPGSAAPLCSTESGLEALSKPHGVPHKLGRALGFLREMQVADKLIGRYFGDQQWIVDIEFLQAYRFSYREMLAGANFLLRAPDVSEEARSLLEHVMSSASPSVKDDVLTLHRIYTGEHQISAPAADCDAVKCGKCRPKPTVPPEQELNAVSRLDRLFSDAAARSISTSEALLRTMHRIVEARLLRAEAGEDAEDLAPYLKSVCLSEHVSDGLPLIFGFKIPAEVLHWWYRVEVNNCVQETRSLYALEAFVTGLLEQLHAGLRATAANASTLVESIELQLQILEGI